MVVEAYLAHSVLDDTAHVTDGDEDTRSVEEADLVLPCDIGGSSCRSSFEPAVPCARNDDKEHKDQDLQDETSKDDVLAALDTVVVLGLHQ